MSFFDRITNEVRLMFRRPERMQCAALCYRFKKKSLQPEMLVITSRDTGRWIIPKGWPMDGKKSHEVAAREAWEEAGVKGDASPDSIGSFAYQKGLDHGMSVRCRAKVYSVAVLDMAKRYPEKGSRKLEWVSFREAASRVAEPELKDLILSFERQLLDTMHPAQKTAAG